MRHDSRSKILPALILVLLGLGVTALWLRPKPDQSRGTNGIGTNALQIQKMAAQLTALEAKERQADETIWFKERLAERCGLVFEQFWDALNAATNKTEDLRAFAFEELIVGQFKPAQGIGHGIELREPDENHSTWDAGQWRQFLEQLQREGWQLVQTEFRHNRFETDAANRPKQSEFYFSANAINPSRHERASLEGNLIVDWAAIQTGEGQPVIKRIDASHLRIKTRLGEPPLRPILLEEISPTPGSHFIDPLILYDLDGDGLSEIILAAKNLIYRRSTEGRFQAEPLCCHSPGLIFTGVIADFDGDGFADFLCAKFEGLFLFHGSPRGTFDEPGRLVWQADPHLKYGQVLTCGDVDGDGDLDVWLGQYKVPYERGQMPSPYDDANDGYSAYLLKNDGLGNFSDVTAESGLEPKRMRRCYSASFVDLDNDGDLDLMVVSDFAGLDLYENDGHGHFIDVTRQWVAEPHAFGMAHAIADFDVDGRMDFLMIGMNSPTADRLEHLRLNRPGSRPAELVRKEMTFGNRLYLSRAGKPLFQQSVFSDTIARSGWSWGCSAFDFDNDGFPDVYIANGHESKRSVRDYDPEFWLHDIYAADSKESTVGIAFFGAQFARTRGRGHSFGGYEKNRFYLNQNGTSFVEAGHLLGGALEEDSRNVVADDLDGDGRMDLLVTTFEVWPKIRQTLRVFQNTLDDGGNWIGFRLREQAGGPSPVGAQVTLHHRGGATTRQIVTGDSYRSQHANTVHFGLGKITQVERVEVRWTDGRTVVLNQPAINQYHVVKRSDGGIHLR